jgi:hypothetical protein
MTVRPPQNSPERRFRAAMGGPQCLGGHLHVVVEVLDGDVPLFVHRPLKLFFYQLSGANFEKKFFKMLWVSSNHVFYFQSMLLGMHSTFWCCGGWIDRAGVWYRPNCRDITQKHDFFVMLQHFFGAAEAKLTFIGCDKAELAWYHTKTWLFCHVTDLFWSAEPK